MWSKVKKVMICCNTEEGVICNFFNQCSGALQSSCAIVTLRGSPGKGFYWLSPSSRTQACGNSGWAQRRAGRKILQIYYEVTATVAFYCTTASLDSITPVINNLSCCFLQQCCHKSLMDSMHTNTLTHTCSNVLLRSPKAKSITTATERNTFCSSLQRACGLADWEMAQWHLAGIHRISW